MCAILLIQHRTELHPIWEPNPVLESQQPSCGVDSGTVLLPQPGISVFELEIWKAGLMAENLFEAKEFQDRRYGNLCGAELQ